MVSKIPESVEEWVAHELKYSHKTSFELFRDCWAKVNPAYRPINGSLRFKVDAELHKNSNGNKIPEYVRKFWERYVRRRVFPFRIV